MTEPGHQHSTDPFPGAGVGCAVLMPHAPVLVPGVSGERGDAAAASRQALRQAAAAVLARRPEAVVLISPHSPRQPGAFGLWAEDPLQGSFAQFAAPQVRVSLPLDQALARLITVEALAQQEKTWEISDAPLDHGALVPLWFLAEAGWAGPTVIISLKGSGGNGLTALGGAIAAAARRLPRRIALIASGDMSHRLAAGAPCGFHPQAGRFDEAFIHLLRAGDYRGVAELPPELRELAAEDAVDVTLIAAAAVHWQNPGHEVLNYEAPFGVGYGVAVLFADTELPHGAEPTEATGLAGVGEALPTLARRSVAAALRDSDEPPPAPIGGDAGAPHAVFVTLRQADGALRGCVGTITPTCPNLWAETWRSARLAALHDHRFTPVTPGELAGLRFEVSVLHAPEAVASPEQLDPQRYGVIVATRDGRRGLLLPGIPEITTVERQLHIARHKGGITPDEPVTLQRFVVDHFAESD